MSARRQHVSRDSDPVVVRDFILGDAFLRAHYVGMYRSMLDIAFAAPGSAPIVEVGGAPGIVREVDCDVIVGDIVKCETVDLVFGGEKLPFADASVRALLLKDSFHHLADIEAFLEEARRVLTPGGVVVVQDPYWGRFASFIYRRFHPEPFDPAAERWGAPATDRWHSNQALLGIVLRRDRARLAEVFPDIHVTEYGSVVGLAYVLSGGVYSRTRVPAPVLLALRSAERRSRLLGRAFCIGYLVSLRFSGS